MFQKPTTINQQPTANQQLPKLKVCGLTQLDQIGQLVAMDVDFLGFIFYEKSPRYVLNRLSLQEIGSVCHSGKVGVFVNENIDKIVEISQKAQLNFIQLHGDEDMFFIENLRTQLNENIKIIKVVRIGNQTSEELQQTIYQITSNKCQEPKTTNQTPPTTNQTPPTINHQPPTTNHQPNIDYLLFDTDSKVFGGTGKTFDWRILNELNIGIPYFLSGGISLENGKNSFTLRPQPYALDINSKFELSAGVKNLKAIAKFQLEISNCG